MSSPTIAAAKTSPVEQHADRVDKLEKLAEKLHGVCSMSADLDWAAKKAAIKARIEKALGVLVTEAQTKQNEARTAADAALLASAGEKLALLAKQSDYLKDASQVFEGRICSELCTTEGSDGKPRKATVLDVCTFRDPVPATAAVIADWESVEALAEYIGAPRRKAKEWFGEDVTELPADPFAGGSSTRVKPAKLPAAGTPPPAPPPSTGAETAIATMDKPRPTAPTPGQCSGHLPGAPTKSPTEAFARPAATEGASALSLGGLDIGATAAQTVDVALAALAKVIEDRAKRESLVWFLEQMHERICGDEDENPRTCCDKDCQDRREAIRELRTYWLPTTCALARNRNDYVQYGGGASLVRALQGAVATDVRSWPGAAAGLGVSAVFWATAENNKTAPFAGSFSCNPLAPQANLCKPNAEIRRATAKLVGQIQGGSDALSSLYLYGTTIDDLNLQESNELYNKQLQVVACMMSLPRVFQTFGDQARKTTTDRKDEIEALLLSGLASAPACFTIVGEGHDRAECGAFQRGPDAGPACSKNDVKRQIASECLRLEHLSTIVRWYLETDTATERAVTQWGVVKTAWETYFAALEDMKNNGGGKPFELPPFDAGNARTFAELLEAFDGQVKDSARAAQQTQQVKLLQASAALARASLDFGVTLTGSLGSVADEKLFPGLAVDTTVLKATLALTSKRLGEYSHHVATAESALNQDWGSVVAQIVASARTVLDEQCKTDAQCKELVKRLSQYSGLFTALVTERDPEKVAQALDAAAMPIGGWRQKQVKGATTISLTAFPGFGTGLEKRWGQYGATLERGGEVYWAAPALQLPLGIDFTRGFGTTSFGGFVSLIDPAAYLQYDPDKQGRLPGAQILTALAPGTSLHVGLGRSPFVLSVYGVVRPNFRAWQSDAAAPGATVFQLGGSIAVDVTLFELWAHRP